MYFLILGSTAIGLELFQSLNGVYSNLSFVNRIGMLVKDLILAFFWPVTLTILSLAFVYHGHKKALEYLNPHLTGKL